MPTQRGCGVPKRVCGSDGGWRRAVPASVGLKAATAESMLGVVVYSVNVGVAYALQAGMDGALADGPFSSAQGPQHDQAPLHRRVCRRKSLVRHRGQRLCRLLRKRTRREGPHQHYLRRRLQLRPKHPPCGRTNQSRLLRTAGPARPLAQKHFGAIIDGEMIASA